MATEVTAHDSERSPPPTIRSRVVEVSRRISIRAYWRIPLITRSKTVARSRCNAIRFRVLEIDKPRTNCSLMFQFVELRSPTSPHPRRQDGHKQQEGQRGQHSSQDSPQFSHDVGSYRAGGGSGCRRETRAGRPCHIGGGSYCFPAGPWRKRWSWRVRKTSLGRARRTLVSISTAFS